MAYKYVTASKANYNQTTKNWEKKKRSPISKIGLNSKHSQSCRDLLMDYLQAEGKTRLP